MSVPSLRAFRGLRFDASIAGDLARLVSPPYDVISPEVQGALHRRDPHNAVRVEFPEDQPGDEPDAKYRRAARSLAEWRSEGALRKDARPGLYAYEQTYRAPGEDEPRTQRGFFARLKLEPFNPQSGVRPHERTLSAPKEDRLRLLRATGTNTSAVMALYRSGRRSVPLLDALTERSPDADVCDDEDVRHRLWYAAADGEEAGEKAGDGRSTTIRDPASALLALAGEHALTIADGHHRYETALRYREERNRACESDPPFDYILCGLFDMETEPLTVLPTHRLVRTGVAGERLLARASEFFEVTRLPSARALVEAMRRGSDRTRFGLYTDGTAAVLHPRPEPLARLMERIALPLRDVDAAVLAVALERLLGITAAHEASSELSYTKDATEAVRTVDAGDAISAFLLDPTPPQTVARVAEAGEVMPQKSTYFYPKVITGLVFNALES